MCGVYRYFRCLMSLCVCMVRMVRITAEALYARSQDLSVSISALGTHRVPYLRQLLLMQEQGIKPMPFDVEAQGLKHCSIRTTRVMT